MADLTVTYLGKKLKNPIIAGASEMTGSMDTLKRLERSGAAAVVIKSLFEEQIMLERFRFEEDLQKGNNRYAEMTTVFPNIRHAGVQEHVMWVKKAKEMLSIPVFASLNAVTPESWTEYAIKLQETGVDGLEINIYDVPTDYRTTAAAIEERQFRLVKDITREISIPIAVKLSQNYTNPLNFIKHLDELGISAVVLFNRFFQPDIDIEKQQDLFSLNLSRYTDHRVALRFIGLLSGNIRADLCASGGIFDGADCVKMLLAGATCVQVVTTLYQNKIEHIQTMIDELSVWMEEKKYTSINDFRGTLDRNHSKDPWRYARSQYVNMLLRPSDEILRNDRPMNGMV
ncbi:MAG: dihydroorotate dehydrogenase-like protein [Chitinivibrionales bacterium]|nr:dihydroorotate dehydrogenase-like protein [Chitinivibrionales bacterium]